jgi:RNA polymerase primary sigma factor
MYALLEQSNERPSAEEIAKESRHDSEWRKRVYEKFWSSPFNGCTTCRREDSNLYDVLRSGESPNPDRELIHESLRTEIERS